MQGDGKDPVDVSKLAQGDYVWGNWPPYGNQVLRVERVTRYGNLYVSRRFKDPTRGWTSPRRAYVQEAAGRQWIIAER